MRLKIASIAAATVLLGACTTNPYTGERQAGKAVTYGAGAAAVCGIIGSMDSSKHARNAALGCGVVGAGVGAYMDVQEAKLREQLQGSGVQSNSYNLRGDFYPTLNAVGEVLSKYGETTLRVTGHTDNTGSRQLNQELSERRAGSVADYLVTRDVSRSRMLVQGMAFDQPVADNSSEQGRAQNRRVELYILPQT